MEFKREISLGQILNLLVILVGIAVTYGQLEARVVHIENNHAHLMTEIHDLSTEVIRLRETATELRTLIAERTRRGE